MRQGLLASELGSKLRVFDATKEAGKEIAVSQQFQRRLGAIILIEFAAGNKWETHLILSMKRF